MNRSANPFQHRDFANAVDGANKIKQKRNLKKPMENKSSKKLLFITGSGASKSLTKENSSTIFHFSYGKYQTLPLGEELIGRIVAYKSKSFCWLVSLFCWRLVNEFEKNWQNKFFNFAKKVEGFWPKYISYDYQPYYPDSSKKAKDSEEICKKIAEEFSKNAYSQNSNFLKEKLKQKSSESFQETLVKTLFFTLLELLKQDIEHSIKQDNILQDNILTEKFLEDLWNKISNIFRNLNSLLEPNTTNNLHEIKNTIDGVGIYERRNHRWKEAKEKILKSTSSEENYDVVKGLENQNFASAIEHLKKFFVIASIVEHYRPYSIDYFMMNLRQLAPFEFFDYSTGKKLVKKATKEREKEIQKYTKFIIAECLGNSALFGKIEAQYQDNYFRRLRWKILENAFFYYRDTERENAFEKYLKDDVKVITFNYENSLDLIVFESFGLEAAKNFLRKNVSHVYGSLELEVYLKKNGKKISEKKSNWSEDALFKSLFDDYERTKLFPGFFSDDKEYSCANIFEQIDKSIKWIGEKDNPEKIAKAREKHRQQFNEADEIYFLGFGFDSENLYRLGIINKNQQLENSLILRGKKILISGANPKIISGVRKIFKTTNQVVDSTLTTLSEPNLGFEILLSSELLPEALSKDL